MKRNEYIEALGAALSAADASVRDDIIREMEGHIDELAERKPELGEEALIATLSPPTALAAGLLEELGFPEAASLGRGGADSDDSAHQGSSRAADAAEADGKAAGSAFGERHGDNRDRRERNRKSAFRAFDEPGSHGFTINIDESDFDGLDELNELGEKLKESFSGLDGLGGIGATIRDAVRRAVRGFGGGLDRASREWSASLDVEDVDELSLDFSRADMTIEPQEGSSLSLEIEVEGEPDVLGDYEPLVTREGRALAIKDAEGSRARRLEIRIPASILRLAVDTVSGDIECDAGGRDLRISTVSGDVELERSDRAQVTTVSGDIDIRDCAALVLETKSGDMDIEDIPGMVRAKSASGDIRIEGAGGPVEATSLSGDLELGLGEGPLKASTASGNVNLDAGSGFAGGEVDSKSGDIEADLAGADLEIFAETVSGDVELGDEDAPDSIPRRLKAVAGKGGARLVLRSVSGNVRADWD